MTDQEQGVISLHQSIQFSCSLLSDSLATPWIVACQTSLSITNYQSLLKFMSIQLVMPSNHLSHPLLFPSPAFNFSQHKGVFKWSVLHIRWPECWNFSFSISSSNEYSGLISFRMDIRSPCSPRDSPESSLAPQFKIINSSALSFLYSPTLTSVHDYWKNHSLEQMDLYWQSNVSAS